MKKFLVIAGTFVSGIFIGHKWPEIRKKFQDLTKKNFSETVAEQTESLAGAVEDAASQVKNELEDSLNK